ncbi:2-enoyl-CoA hydratase [Helicosporidium sp. ATCC 50920]|nr:2-enoyl-CoA hydratase [Helicosporidium sp. ATCC 50920]|eukprot:KDD73109.1 2-enoyl-CoA hydratase [Helicosporidium sp. ATCC 50920]
MEAPVRIHHFGWEGETVKSKGFVFVLFDADNGIAKAILNRPKALNALNLEMVELMVRQYRAWHASGDVNCLILRGAGPKAFCAGGDVKTVVLQSMEGRWQEAMAFFETEYKLNHALATLPFPHVAILDGITMGGGVGVSVHGAYRVATEKLLFAMPECAIGLYPDVGGSHFLPRLAPGLGLYLGLTGARLKGAECLRAGIATHYVPSAALPDLLRALEGLGRGASSGTVQQVLDTFQAREAVPEAAGFEETLAQSRALFDGAGSLEEIYRRLEDAQGNAWARSALEMMSKGSPLSQKVTFEQLRRGAGLSLADCLRMEHRMVQNIVRDPRSDFVAGVRALLIDKTNSPQWRHASVADVTEAEVEAFFEPASPPLDLPTAEPKL